MFGRDIRNDAYVKLYVKCSRLCFIAVKAD